MAISALRGEFLRQHHLLHASLLFTCQLTFAHVAEIELAIKSVNKLKVKQLESAIKDRERKIYKTLRATDCKLTPAEFLELLEISKAGLPGSVLMIPKWKIDGEYFGDYGSVHRLWATFPSHALVVFDPRGVKPGDYQWVLPEANLYEDMCFAFNGARRLELAKASRTLTVLESKEKGCLTRTAVLSAFYFVEAYLNGVAFDHFHGNKSSLPVAQVDLLLEWNTSENKEMWLNFRRKFNEYQKIILKEPTPRLTDSNCPELKLILDEGKNIRDSIVHQSPKPAHGKLDIPKQKAFTELSLEQAGRIVDASIKLTRTLNKLVAAKKNLEGWLFDRDASGYFPKKAFE